jgi:glycosyltransferase involved in cell wall biosynthesis
MLSNAERASLPIVSIVVPVYNTEAYLKRCLQSIQRQEFTDMEILCVDDGSSDASVLLLQEFVALDSRIQLIRHAQNLGLGGARNTGIRGATGRYIMSVDSDDYVDSDFVGAAVAAAEASRADIVAFGIRRVSQGGAVLRETVLGPDLLPGPYANPFGVTNPSFCTKLWRRSLFTSNDIWFPEHLYYEDLATTPRLLSRASAVERIGGTPYNYVVRRGSITQTNSHKHAEDMATALSILRDFFVADNKFGVLEQAWRSRVMQAIDAQEKLSFMGGGTFLEKLSFSRDLRTTVLDRLALIDQRENHRVKLQRSLYALRLHLGYLVGAKEG